MSREWTKYTLGTLCDLITDGKHGDCVDQPNSGFYFLSVKDVVGNRLVYENARQIAERDFLETHCRTNLKPGDVLFTNTGTIGRMAIARDDPRTFRTTFQKSVAVLKPNKVLIDPRFLYYSLQSDNTRLADLAAGTTQRNLLLKDFRSFEIRIPPLPEQVEIAAVLGALDDKIELNRRMNETLEAMARAIFKDWFVDFGPTRAKQEVRAPYLAPEIWSHFPDRLDDDGRPEGWIAKPLDQIAEFLNGIALQKYPASGGAFLPVIKIAQLRAGSAVSADQASTDIPATYVVEDGDVIFSWSGSLLHRVWTAGRGALNQHLFKVTSDKFPKWFYFYWIGHHMPSFQATAASKATTMGHIQRHHLTQAMTMVASSEVMNAANELIAPLFNCCVANDLESRTLAKTRDLLLPKLMSGEVRVKDAERLVGEAT
jgi:type I restriction enzyme, S subunit